MSLSKMVNKLRGQHFVGGLPSVEKQTAKPSFHNLDPGAVVQIWQAESFAAFVPLRVEMPGHAGKNCKIDNFEHSPFEDFCPPLGKEYQDLLRSSNCESRNACSDKPLKCFGH